MLDAIHVVEDLVIGSDRTNGQVVVLFLPDVMLLAPVNVCCTFSLIFCSALLCIGYSMVGLYYYMNRIHVLKALRLI